MYGVARLLRPRWSLGEAPTRLLYDHGVLLIQLKQLVEAVLKNISSALGLNARYAVPIPPDKFFVTTSGKIQRTAFQRAFLGGEYISALRALDLGLGTSPHAAPDFFATAALVPKPPMALPMPLGIVVWIASRDAHDALREGWAAAGAALGHPNADNVIFFANSE